MSGKLIATFAAAYLALSGATLLATQAPAAENKAPLKVGFIYVGPASDLGWNFAHDQGRRYLEKTLKGRVQTEFVENVPESGEVERVAEKMIAHGDKLIFSTSYGYLEPIMRVAMRHPEIIFMQCQRHSNLKNLGTYIARQSDPYYIAGFVAGKVTKTNKLGYIGGHPVPAVVICVNAFTLGAQRANPKAHVQVVWNNSWDDPANEAEATKGLVESGADVIASQLDTSSTVVQTAEKEHVNSVGGSGDWHQMAPHGWLVGQIWTWGPLYVKTANLVLSNKWKAENAMYSMKDGYVGISQFGTAVPLSVRKEAKSIQQSLENDSFYVFKGPMKDRSGVLRIPSGKILDSSEIRSIDWLVPGVEGNLAKK